MERIFRTKEAARRTREWESREFINPGMKRSKKARKAMMAKKAV